MNDVFGGIKRKWIMRLDAEDGSNDSTV